MKHLTVNEKRSNTLIELSTAGTEVNNIRRKLYENLEEINKVLYSIKKRKKIISSLTYLKLNWLNSIDYEEHLKMAERALKAYSDRYKIEILKRKILKNKFKQAQRKFSKKKKKIGMFDEKYFSRKD